ncbi:MAG: carbohydrate ABC transporter permease [Paracoccaceae bacterium]
MLRSRGTRIFAWLFLGLFSATMLIPLLNVVATSFTSKAASLEPGVILWPGTFSFSGYETLFNRLRFWLPFMNTMYVTVVGTVVHVLLASVAGYALAQENLPGRNLIGGIILVTLTIPTQTILVPLFIVFRDFGLLNTLLSLIVAELVSAFSILLMKTYFSQVPKQLIESAKIDGAGHFRLFWDFYVPLALPGIITVTAFNIVWKYNLFIEPLLFISDPKKTTLQIALQAVVMGEGTTSTNEFIAPNVMMAGIVVALVPLLLFFPFMQRYLVSGMMLGGVKE